ncbi:MAG: formate acetyltransferase, partial [Dehalococcoidia bacterium]|nr:formate acetyltransferase [Dehalococcoidia bacterium]
WAAEKKRSKRLDYLRKAVWKKGAIGGVYTPGLKIDLERPLLWTEAYKANEYDPVMLRQAKALANVLDNVRIFITDHAQLVGYLGSLPHTQIWNQDVASMFNEQYYNAQGVIPEPVEESLKTMTEINNYWSGKTELDKVIRQADPEDVVKVASGTIMWGVPLSSAGYATKDYEYIFGPDQKVGGGKGFEDVYNEIQRGIDEAEEKLAGNPGPDILPLYDRLPNWEAMQLVLEAGIRYARRYARLARIIAENFETDPKRKEELLRIAETCERVPAKTPRNLQESLQYDHFVQVLARMEAIEGAWPARPDYYHGAYYEKDVNIEKTLTEEEAIDLVGEFLIRTYETGFIGPSWVQEGLQGIPGTWVWTLGGVKKDGSDACNNLTVAFLRAARLVRQANPTFAFRWHPKVKDEVMREVFECIREGLGYPSIRNDPILINNGMYWHGHPLEEMRTWVHQACMSPCPCTKHGSQPMRMANTTLNCAKMVEFTLHNGYDHVLKMQMGPKTGDARQFTDFEQ